MVKRPWFIIRWIIIIFAILSVFFCVGLIFWGNNSSSNDIAFALLAGISGIIALGQLIISLPQKPDQPSLPSVIDLVLDNPIFKMGDTSAAKFSYVKPPIENAYSITSQTLKDASIGIGPKCGVLVRGATNAGKTRLALQALKETLPDWKVILWKLTYDSPSKVPTITGLKERGLVVFIDDLQNYIPSEAYIANLPNYQDNRITTLNEYLSVAYDKKRLVIVATCRSEEETQVRVRLAWLFDMLNIVTIPDFRERERQDPKLREEITELFKQHGPIEEEAWDGTLGSLVLGFSKKLVQYMKLYQASLGGDPPEQAVKILHAMKLLYLARIPDYTYLRIQKICISVFGVSILTENTKMWESFIDKLSWLQFITANNHFALEILNNSYFDKVICQYPNQHRVWELDQHFQQLQNVLVELNDAPALVNLGIAQSNRKQYEKALDAYNQAIHFDPHNANTFYNKGIALHELRRRKEAVAAYDQAIHLDPNNADFHSVRGVALRELKQYEEALAAYDQAIRLDPNNTAAHDNKDSTLRELKRYEEAMATYNQATYLYSRRRYKEALAAYDQAIHLDPSNAVFFNARDIALRELKQDEEALAVNDQTNSLVPDNTAAHDNKDSAQRELKRYKEAMATYNHAMQLHNRKQYEEALNANDQAIRLNPTHPDFYYLKGVILFELKQYEGAEAAYDQAIRLNPTDPVIYNDKGFTLLELERYEEAMAAYDQAIRLNPTNVDFYKNKVAVLLNELKQYDKALDPCSHIIRLEPNNAASYKLMGMVLYKLMRYIDALVFYDQATRLDPTHVIKISSNDILLC
jgi:tetratricopeptide (TPR) repeat protein